MTLPTIEQLDAILADAVAGPWGVPDQTYRRTLTVETMAERAAQCPGSGGAMSYTHDVCTLGWSGTPLWDATAALIALAPTLATQRIADAKRIAELEADVARLIDGISAIRQYGWDTLTGPTTHAEDTRDWQRAAVNEMTKRAVRLADGKTWDATQ